MYSMAGLAEYSVVPATAIFPRPPSVPVEEAAILGCAALTAYGAVLNRRRPSPRGTRRCSGHRRRRLADRAVRSRSRSRSGGCYRRERGASCRPRARRDARHRRIDRGSRATAARADRRRRRRCVLRGAWPRRDVPASACHAARRRSHGRGRDRPDRRPAPIEITRLVRRGLRIIGSYGARPRSDMPRLLALIENGVLHPEAGVTRRFSLAEAQKAYDALDRREIVGRAVVVMPSADGATP